MAGEVDDKEKVADTEKDSSSLKDQDKDKGKQFEAVPYARFKEVNDERNEFKTKAEALDALWSDPEFQNFLKEKEEGGGKGGKEKTKEDVEDDETLDRPLTLREARKFFAEDLQKVVKEALSPIDKQREEEQLEKAMGEVKSMEKDDEKFPYFKPWKASEETDKIRTEMVRLMEQEGIKTMQTAYRLATEEVRERDKAKREKDVREQERFGRPRNRSTIALRGGENKPFKSPREAAEDAANKLDF